MIFRILIIIALLSYIILFIRKVTTYAFKVYFVNGRIVKLKGKLDETTLSLFNDIASNSNITGNISSKDYRTLIFSNTIKASDKQRFRNVFFLNMK